MNDLPGLSIIKNYAIVKYIALINFWMIAFRELFNFFVYSKLSLTSSIILFDQTNKPDILIFHNEKTFLHPAEYYHGYCLAGICGRNLHNISGDL